VYGFELYSKDLVSAQQCIWVEYCAFHFVCTLQQFAVFIKYTVPDVLLPRPGSGHPGMVCYLQHGHGVQANCIRSTHMGPERIPLTDKSFSKSWRHLLLLVRPCMKTTLITQAKGFSQRDSVNPIRPLESFKWRSK
jgi:hypothetical protein